MTKHEIKVFTSICDTIRLNVYNVKDVDGYLANCLLYDVKTAAHYYGVTDQTYKRLVCKAGEQVTEDNQ